MSTNHHDPKTSNSPARSKNVPTSPWLARYWSTRSGEFGHCGINEPATDARARSISRIRAVRIERKVRQMRATERCNEDPAEEEVMGATRF